MSELVVLHFARTLNLDPAKLEWAKTWVRETLPFGTQATVLDVTATGALSEWLSELCAHRRIPLIVFAQDGVRYEMGSIPRLPAMGTHPEDPSEPLHDYGVIEERPWLDATAPGEPDHRRLCAVRAGVSATVNACVAGWTIWSLLLRDREFPELYIPLTRNELELAAKQVTGAAAGNDAAYPQTLADLNPPAEAEVPPVGDGDAVLSLQGAEARLAQYDAAVQKMTLPGEAVALWLHYRPVIRSLPAAESIAAWNRLCDRTNVVGSMKNAQVWIRKAVEVEERRRDPARSL